MKLTQLQYFMCISECGSFTKAAEQLHITQPSLSKAIAELEVEAGTTLLLRTKSGVQLTQEGQIVLEQVRNVSANAASISHIKNWNTSDYGLLLYSGDYGKSFHSKK